MPIFCKGKQINNKRRLTISNLQGLINKVKLNQMKEQEHTESFENLIKQHTLVFKPIFKKIESKFDVASTADQLRNTFQSTLER